MGVPMRALCACAVRVCGHTFGPINLILLLANQQLAALRGGLLSWSATARLGLEAIVEPEQILFVAVDC